MSRVTLHVDMQQNTTRIALAIAGQRLDLAVPARRPVGEFLPRLVELGGSPVQPEHGWHLVRVGGELIDPERSLAESAVLDGELIQLAPALAAPDGGAVLDDVRGAVAKAASPRPRSRSTTGYVFHALAAAATVGLSLSLAAGGIAGGAVACVVAAAVLGGAAWLRISRREIDATIWAFAALVPAAVAGWTLGRNTSISTWWVPAVLAAAVAAVAAAVAVPSRHAVLVPLAAGLVAAAAWCVVFAAGVREPGTIGGPAVIAGFVLIEIVPSLSFHVQGVGRLHRESATERKVTRAVHRARLMIVAGNVAAGVLITIGAAALATGDDPWGWGLAALAGAVLALHTRLYTHLDEMIPIAAAAVIVALLLVTLAVLPRAGWPAAAAAATGLTIALAAAGARPPALRPLTRRRLSRAEAICAVPLVVAALMASGLGEALYRSGQSLA